MSSEKAADPGNGVASVNVSEIAFTYLEQAGEGLEERILLTYYCKMSIARGIETIT